MIAEPKRRQILQLVWNEPVAAGDIAAHFDVTFGAVSQHLKLLRESGAVAVTKDGNRRIYRADLDVIGPLAPALEAMWADRLDALAQAVEAT